jgi:3',5'-cyclic AMP phosphodiesterase CpdA
VILAHLSDLHLRDEADAVEFARQLDRIVARRADHLVITGDLLDWWDEALLDRALEALAARNLLSARALTLLHGNHDLASSGGHPRRRADLRRLVLRFWDPPPLIAARRRRFYGAIERRAPGLAAPPPFLKRLDQGVAIAVLDSILAPWVPLTIHGREIRLYHATGAIEARQTDWLRRQTIEGTLVVLVHHYPLDVAPYEWRSADTAAPRRSWLDRWQFVVPMAIRLPDRDRFWSAAADAGAAAVLCGHVHRTRVEQHRGIMVGLNGQSGAAWAGRTIAYYRIGEGPIEQEYESADSGRA